MQRILLTALVAGLVSGLFAFGIQSFKLTPLILEAETYEDSAAATLEPAAGEHADDGHHHDEDAWEPANGFERNAWRLAADLGMGVGFALLLVGAFSLRNVPMDARTGILWGLAGFACFSLAPGFGLPPELPATMAADLMDRQIWWAAAALSTAAALALIVFSDSTFRKILGVALMVAPHILGAPRPPLGGVVPTELNAEFASASLVTMALFWVVLGAVAGWFYGRYSRQTATA